MMNSVTPRADPRGIRILLPEGSSTSGRQAITALGLKGYALEVCDPAPICLGRFSRYVQKFHRCPGLGVDPQGFLDSILDLVARRQFDVLLPIHEQGFLLAKVQRRLAPHVALALPSFDSYRLAHSKAGFSRLLTELDLPQPDTRFVTNADALRAVTRFPVVVKMAIGTASRGVWVVNDVAALRQTADELAKHDGFGDAVLVQDFVAGPLEHAQAIFSHGHLLALHGYIQIARGAGGGEAIKESVHRPAVRTHLQKLGQRLAWHGALSVDYIMPQDGGGPLYIDCNPRLVEPMSALIAGQDLADVLVRLSLGETFSADIPDGRDGIRTHMALKALLGCAVRGGSRRDIARECMLLAAGRGPYANSREELTPWRLDWPSVAATVAVAWSLLKNPQSAHALPKRLGAHLLNPGAVRAISRMDA